MKIGLKDLIVAVVTINKDSIGTSSIAPIFYAKDEEELEVLSQRISKVVDGVVHDLQIGTYVIVKH